jgi:hypothetical protein
MTDLQNLPLTGHDEGTRRLTHDSVIEGMFEDANIQFAVLLDQYQVVHLVVYAGNC